MNKVDLKNFAFTKEEVKSLLAVFSILFIVIATLISAISGKITFENSTTFMYSWKDLALSLFLAMVVLPEVLDWVNKKKKKKD